MVAVSTPLSSPVRDDVITDLKRHLTPPSLDHLPRRKVEYVKYWLATWFESHVFVVQMGGIQATKLREDIGNGYYPLVRKANTHLFPVIWSIPRLVFPMPFEPFRDLTTPCGSRELPDGRRVTFGTEEELLTRFTPEEQASWPP